MPGFLPLQTETKQPDLEKDDGLLSGFLLQRTIAVLTAKMRSGIDSLVSVGKELARRSLPMPGDPKECRQHALNCVRLAQTATTPQSREHFANLAQTWVRLADELENAQSFLNALDEETEPIRAAE